MTTSTFGGFYQLPYVGIGLIIILLIGIFVTTLCVARKKPFKRKVKRMRQLSSAFFERKRKRQLQAQRQATKLQSKEKSIPHQSEGNPIVNHADKKEKENTGNVNIQDNPSFVLDEIKTDSAHSSSGRISAENGTKATRTSNNIASLDTKLHVEVELSPEQSTTEYLESDNNYSELIEDDNNKTSRKQPEEQSTDNSEGYLEGKNESKGKANKTSDSKYTSTENVKDKKVTQNLCKNNGHIDGNEKSSETSGIIAVDVHTVEQEVNMKAKGGKTEISTKHKFSTDSQNHSLSTKEKCSNKEAKNTNERKDHDGLIANCHNQFPNHQSAFRKESKSLTEHRSKQKWKTKINSERGAINKSNVRDKKETVHDSAEIKETNFEETLQKEHDDYEYITDWVTKEPDEAASIESTEKTNLPSQVTAIINKRHNSEKEFDDDVFREVPDNPVNDTKSQTTSSVNRDRDIDTTRKTSSTLGSSGSDNSSVFLSQDEFPAQNTTDAKDDTVHNATRVHSERTKHGNNIDHLKSASRKKVAQRKSALQPKRSSESGYGSCSSMRDRHESEMSFLSTEPIREENETS